MRGDGFVYKQGSRWWVGFRAGGRLHRRAARLPDKEGVLRPAENETEARRFLKAQRAAVLGGRFLTTEQERITVGELLDPAEARAKARGLRSLKKLRSHARALRGSFVLVRGVDVTPPRSSYTKPTAGPRDGRLPPSTANSTSAEAPLATCGWQVPARPRP